MLIEIHGAGFVNKGAQLMLLTVLERLRREFSNASFCIEAGRDRPYDDVAAAGLYLPWPMASTDRPRKFPFLWYASTWTNRCLPRRAFEPFGLVRRQDIDGLIDISGYSFGDKWPLWFTTHFTRRARFYRSQGKPVILLPQMFGPFTNQASRNAFKNLMRETTLVFARDQISFAHVMEVAPEYGDRLRVAPDITIFASPSAGLQNVSLPSRPFACIIPNERMIDKAGLAKRDYLASLVVAGRRIQSHGLAVCVLVHASSRGDLELATALARTLASDTILIDDLSPQRLKLVISQASFLLGSRFHGLVAALSSGIPAIALGWSHKYQMLLENFHVPELVYDLAQGIDGLLELIDRVANSEHRARLAQSIQDSKASMFDNNLRMWQEVCEVLTPYR